MDHATGASSAINLTILMVEEALKMKFPRRDIPTESRQIMIDILARTVADLRDVAAKQEAVIGWGSQVILKRAKKPPVWVECVPGIVADDDGFISLTPKFKWTPEFEGSVDEVAKHLRNGRLVVWGSTGLKDERIRGAILVFNKIYHKRNPSFRGTRWDVQPPTSWKVFYVLGMDDIEDLRTPKGVSRALKAGKRIIDITGSAPVDLTDIYSWAAEKVSELLELRQAEG